VTSLVGRRNVATVTVSGAMFVLGCFVVGGIAVRDTTRGVMLIGAMACVVVYLTKPQWMAWVALFLALASLPPGLPVGNGLWPMSAYTYQIALLVAIAFLIPHARLRFSAYVLPGIFLLTVAYFTAAGVAGGNVQKWVNHEALFLVELVAGFVLALLIVRTHHVRECIVVIAAVLWFSAAMILASSLTGLQLIGRAVSLQAETGSAEAIRLLTYTQIPAMAVLAALLAAQIVGRARPLAYLVLGLPALIITLLGFSRDALIVTAVAAAAAFVSTLGWLAVRRLAVLAAVSAGLVAVVVPGTLFLLQSTAAGDWLSDQVNAFSSRVIGGLSPTALAVDSSTLDRLHENAHLLTAFADAPLFGHGLGYQYQLPFGKAESFTATLGTTYAHNFYLWWLAKAGLVGMASFAVFALTPVVRGIRSASAEAKISAAVSAGLLAGCVVDPMPLEPAQSLVLGMALGAAMAFAWTRQGAGQVETSKP
jgi:O-antigen ligase